MDLLKELGALNLPLVVLKYLLWKLVYMVYIIY